MANDGFYRTALTGGASGAVDGIDGDDVVDKDLILAMVSNVLYVYEVDADSAATENSPRVIAFDANGGDKRAVLKEALGTLNKQNLLPNSEFGVWSNSGLTQGTSGRQTDFNVSEKLADADGSTFASWTEAGATMTDAGANLLITENASAGTQTSRYVLTVEVGKLYKVAVVTANGTGAWGASDILKAQANGGGTVIESKTGLAAGTHSIIFETTATNNEIELFTNLAAAGGTTLNITSVYVDEVTPGCVAVDTLCFDGWSKSASANCKIYREHNDGGTNTKDGSFYSLKMVLSDADRLLQYPSSNIYSLSEWMQRFAGRTITLGMWIKASVADNTYLKIYDGSGYQSNTKNTGTGWEWHEFTRTIVANPTVGVMFQVYSDAAATVYISQPMLVFGSSIGEGNFAFIPNEVIRCEKDVILTDYDFGVGDIAADVDAEINIEAQSNGKIPKGVSELYITMKGMDSAVAANIGAWMGPDTTYTAQDIGDLGLWLQGVGNDVETGASGWVRCGSGGDPWLFLNESGANTLDLEIRVQGVRLR